MDENVKRKAGRPAGSTNKLSAVTLLTAIKGRFGKPFEELICDGYEQAMGEEDLSLRLAYEKMILTKVMADPKVDSNADELSNKVTSETTANLIEMANNLIKKMDT